MAKLFNDEQVAFIRENAKGLSNQALTNLINKEFNLSISIKQIKTFKKNNQISSGLTGHFEKGHVPFNKGKKGLTRGGVETQFKKGQQATNYKPVGSERIDRDGYVLIKVSDDGPWHKRWRPKHKVLWEKTHGLIPKEHCLIFLDSNKQNIVLDNLQLITRAQLARMNQNHLISNNAELTKTGLIIAEIYSKMGERKQPK
ncbi:TPA: HNH endonuclease [Bacillus cereus]|nr:HNH endonuclease [Bacillus cereus]HDR7019875.1 HNH endonuclease [Bacillus cereus]